MSVQREFLGWDGPCLPRVVRWLRERYEVEGVCDLSGVVVVTPGARAGRRLLELLIESVAPSAEQADPAEHTVLTPPELITPSSLPRYLCSFEHGLTADALTMVLARWRSLREAEPATLEKIVPHPPAEDDLESWLAMAGDVQRLYEALASQALSFAAAASVLEAKLTDFKDHARWEALEVLQKGYRRILADEGLDDPLAMQRSAVEANACRSQHDIVLVAVAELPQVLRRMLRQVAERVTALVHAPASEADAFDELGCIDAKVWSQRTAPVDDAAVHVVDRPRDQARQMLHLISDAAASDAAVSPDDFTVGLGDEADAGMLERTLELAGVPARAIAGRALSQTPPARLLAAVAAYAQHRRMSDFAALLRHPDVEQYLQRRRRDEDQHADTPPAQGDVADASEKEAGEDAGLADEAPPPPAPANVGLDSTRCLTHLDGYVSDHLQAFADNDWLAGVSERDGQRGEMLGSLFRQIETLIEPPTSAGPAERPADGGDGPPPTRGERTSRRATLQAWSQMMADPLAAIYGGRQLEYHSAEDADLIRSFELIGDALQAQATLPPHSKLAPEMTAAEAVRFTLNRLANVKIPPAGGVAAVELLGWLELQLDDAPALIVTGFNEGAIPASVNADVFLPDSARRALGLPDNQMRYARDVMMLNAMVHSRREVSFIMGRRTMDGDPLTPSRLLFACEDAMLPQRVLAFCESESGLSRGATGLLMRPGREAGDFSVPPPREVAEEELTALCQRLPLSAFSDYLKCPYRFYLRHIVKLRSVDDETIELNAPSFASVARQVLTAFHRSPQAASDDPAHVRQCLHANLETVALQRFGAQPPAAVVLQLQQLRDRLDAFAQWQARRVKAGWRIMPEAASENPHDRCATLDVDDHSAIIVGGFDRLEKHDDGRWFVGDYKTSEIAPSPDKMHKHKGEWVSLNLPLCGLLAQEAGVAEPILGYVALPKDLQKTGVQEAPWHEGELAEARERARQVVRDIMTGRFWPPADPPPRYDAFATICMR